MKHQMSVLIAAFSTLWATACDDREASPSEPSSRDIYFDGAEIEAELNEHPNVMYFADLRNGNVVHFDQSEEPVDFSHFIVQCPTMPGPMMMDAYLASFEDDFSTEERWSIRAAVDSGVDFRSVPPPPPGCYYHCPNGDLYDCVVICPNVE